MKTPEEITNVLKEWFEFEAGSLAGALTACADLSNISERRGRLNMVKAIMRDIDMDDWMGYIESEEIYWAKTIGRDKL